MTRLLILISLLPSLAFGQVLRRDGANGTFSVAVTGPSFTATVASGNNGLACQQNGCRVDFGAGASDYASSDGTTVTFAGPIAASNLSGTNTGNVTIGTANGLTLSTQVLSLSTANINAAGAISNLTEPQTLGAGDKYFPSGVAIGLGSYGTDYSGLSWDGALVSALGVSKAATSPTGEQWTARTGPAGNWNGSTWSSDLSLHIGVGTSVAASSPDGITWTSRTIPTGVWYAVSCNSTPLCVAVGTNVAATSTNGTTWTARTIPAGNYRAVQWNGSIWAAVASNSVGASSPDGTTWTARTTGKDLRSLTVNGSLFVGVGASSGCATSSDAITWTGCTIPSGTYSAVVWTGSLYVAAGVSVAASSPDAATWTARTIPPGHYPAAVWTGTEVVVIGQNNATARTTDGINWTRGVIGRTSYIASSPRCQAAFATTVVPFCDGSTTDCYLDQSITCLGAAVGAECLVGSPAALEAGLTQTCRVSAADTIILTTRNSTHGDITPAGSQTVSVRAINP